MRLSNVRFTVKRKIGSHKSNERLQYYLLTNVLKEIELTHEVLKTPDLSFKSSN